MQESTWNEKENVPVLLSHKFVKCEWNENP